MPQKKNPCRGPFFVEMHETPDLIQRQDLESANLV